MINQELLDYIKQQLKLGKSKEEIKNILTAKGWQPQDIDNALSQTIGVSLQTPTPSPAIPTEKIASLPGPIPLLTNAWEIYKQRFKILAAIMLIPTLALLPFMILTLIGGISLTALILSTKANPIGLGILILLVLMVFIVSAVVETWGHTSLLYAIKDNQEGIGIKESYRRGWRKILPYWWLAFLYGLITTGGIFLFIIPGLIFMVWFSMAFFVLIAEDLRGTNALLKSREYVRGHWRGVFGRLFFIGIFVAAIYLPPTYILESLKLKLASHLVGSVISLLIIPLVMSYYFLIYKNLKSLKGEFSFAPSTKTKAKFIAIGLAGILILLIPLVGIFGLSMMFKPTSQFEKVKDTQRISDRVSIRTALEMYFSDNNSYPQILNQLVPEYLTEVPTDPQTNLPYEYRLLQAGQDYQLCIIFEEEGRECISSPKKELRQQEI